MCYMYKYSTDPVFISYIRYTISYLHSLFLGFLGFLGCREQYILFAISRMCDECDFCDCFYLTLTLLLPYIVIPTLKEVIVFKSDVQ